MKRTYIRPSIRKSTIDRMATAPRKVMNSAAMSAYKKMQLAARAHASEAERHKQRAEEVNTMLEAERRAHRDTKSQLGAITLAVSQAVRQHSGTRQFARGTANDIHAPMEIRNSAVRCLNALDNLEALVKPLDTQPGSVTGRMAGPHTHEITKPRNEPSRCYDPPVLYFGQQSHAQAMVALWVHIATIQGRIGTPETLAEANAQLDAWRAKL